MINSCPEGLRQTSFTAISLLTDGRNTCPDGFWLKCVLKCPVEKGGGHSGRKSRFLSPQDIPDISGYQLGFGCQCVKAYNNKNPVTDQNIL